MYQIGDYLVKANTGLCQVKDILHLDGRNIDKNKLYYLLIPMSDANSKIYLAVDHNPALVRKSLTQQEAWELIKAIPDIEEMQIDNEKQCEFRYREALKSSVPENWVSIIKTMYLRKQSRRAQGKKDTSVDQKYFRLAEDYLYSELAFALGRNKEEMEKLIEETIRKSDSK